MHSEQGIQVPVQERIKPADTTAGTVSPAFGTTGDTACVGNDARLSDTRTQTDASVVAAKMGPGAVAGAAMKPDCALCPVNDHIDSVPLSLGKRNTVPFRKLQHLPINPNTRKTLRGQVV